MGKKSIKENKNMYQVCRENAGYTRDRAGEEMVFVSSDRIEKIESEKSVPHPDEIMAMADCYKAPALRNYYCTHECAIGKLHVPEIRLKDLSQITLELLSSLNNMEKDKNKLISITVDGKISEDEYRDFAMIQKQLECISISVKSLQLWVDQTIANGEIDKKLLKQYYSEISER